MREKNSSSTMNVAIIGAGVGGLSAAIALKRQHGFEDCVIYEKASEVGGTWRDNTYPGCGSDIAIHFYSLSTDLNPYWGKDRETQPEIKGYWERLAEKYDLNSHISYNTKVISADWDNAAQLYHIVVQDLKSEEKRQVDARVLISALGILEIPSYPPGLGDTSVFKGDLFHSANWNHDVDLKGKRVAVIGNGASACQFIPLISEDPTVQLVNFCRTPTWVLRRDRTIYPGYVKWIFAHIPCALRFYRNLLMFRSDLVFLSFYFKSLNDTASKALREDMIKTTPTEYHEYVIPKFAFGCKRTIVDTGYLVSLNRENVSMNWDGIQQFAENGIVTSQGGTIPFDVIILATGYTTNVYPLQVKGTDGLSVQDYYNAQGGPAAYLGTTLPGFPNFYMLSGPNTVTGHSSVIFTGQVQINYAMNFIAPVIRGQVSSFEVTAEAANEYNKKIQSRLTNSIWAQCVSWYRKDGTGKISSLFPGPITLFWWYLRKPNWSHYKAVGAERWIRWRRIQKTLKFVGALAVALVLGWASANRDEFLERHGIKL